ncbi:uncharacterized protein LOC115217394 [Argonauta hians]
MRNFVITTFLLFLTFLFAVSAPTQKTDIYNRLYHLYGTKLCSHGTSQLNVTQGKYPVMPNLKNVGVFTKNGRNGIRVSWSANTQYLKGFQLTFHHISSPPVKSICRVLDYSQYLNQSVSTGTLQFEYSLFPVRKDYVFLVQLRPLPAPKDNSIITQEINTLKLCRKWTTQITYQASDGLIMQFRAAPMKCNVTSYLVSLKLQNGTVLKDVVVNSTQPHKEITYKFSPICDGIYKLTAEIHDSHLFNDCICINDWNKCDSCYRTVTPEITVTGQSCTTAAPTTTASMLTTQSSSLTTPLSGRNDLSRYTIFFVVMGAMFGLSFIGLTFYCARRSPPVKRGLLFYTEDHCYHCAAVGQFISFLKKSRCQVKTAASLPKDDIPLRLSLEIQKADFVILIYSKALHQRLQAWKSNQDYVEFLKEDNSAVLTLPLLKELKSNNKLILCKFAKIPNSAIDCEFSSTKCYTLMKELNSLLKKIHGKGLDKELSMFLKSNVFNNHSNSLEDKIKVAEQFEENNSNWFTDKYMCPKKMDSLNEKFDQLEIFQEGFEPSIYSVPISHMLADINENNDVRV